MQIKLSTTLKAEAIEVAHVTVVIFPSVAREIKCRKSKPADLKILDAPGVRGDPTEPSTAFFVGSQFHAGLWFRAAEAKSKTMWDWHYETWFEASHWPISVRVQFDAFATTQEALATPPFRLDRLDYPRNLMIAFRLLESCQLRSSQQCRWRRDSASLEPHLVDGSRDRSALLARWERI